MQLLIIGDYPEGGGLSRHHFINILYKELMVDFLKKVINSKLWKPFKGSVLIFNVEEYGLTATQ